MNHCKDCHSQLRDDGSHYQMTFCVQDEIARLKARNERLRTASDGLIRAYNKAPEESQEFIDAIDNAFTDFEEATKESE